MEYFVDALRKYADFTGRARRKAYWMFVLIYFIFSLVLSAIDMMIGADIGVLSAIFSLAMLIPSISITTRRLHDTGRSGWWQLILLVPLIGAIVLLVFTVQDSHDENQYGPNPKLGEVEPAV